MSDKARTYEQIGDPLRLPFARLLQECQHIRPAEAYRRFVAAGAAFLTLLTPTPQDTLRLDALRGLNDHDRALLGRAWDQLVTDMNDRPYVDLLGPVYMELSHKLDRDQGGEFYTPHALSVLVSRMQLGGDMARAFTPGEVLTLNEPTAGTGGMVLAFTQELWNAGISPLHTRWVIQDISDRSCHGAFINTTLWGIPAQIVCGNTLTLDYRWQWANPYLPHARPWPTDEERQQAAEREAQFQQMTAAMLAFLRGEAQPAARASQAHFGPLFQEPA